MTALLLSSRGGVASRVDRHLLLRMVCSRQQNCLLSHQTAAGQGAAGLSNNNISMRLITPYCCLTGGSSLFSTSAAAATTVPMDKKQAAPKAPKAATPSASSSAYTGSSSNKYKFFEDLEVTDGGVAVIRINGPGKMNVISDTMAKEFEGYWKNDVAPRNDVKAVVFISSKKDNFIAGADINMIKNMEDKAGLKEVCMNGHAMFDAVSAKGVPVVAAINGACLGGGLEWALHCDYRIATTSRGTVLGLPEVQLGLLPGWGGTQLLHPLVGLQAALDMILKGSRIRPDKAKRMGLVDQLVDHNSLEAVAVATAAELAASGSKWKKRTAKKKSLKDRIIEDTPFGRSIMWKEVNKAVQKSTGGHYPNAKAIIECVQYGLSASSKQAALEFEAKKFSEMAATPVSAALIGLFDSSTALKKNRFGTPPKDQRVNTVAVLGAGLMGAGIAQVSAEKGFHVLLKDRDLPSLAKGEKYISDNIASKMKKKKMTMHDADLVHARIVLLQDKDPASPGLSGKGVTGKKEGGNVEELWQRHFKHANMVIEAVPESMALKHAVIKQAEEYLPEHCVFASNTSALPIGEIAKASKRPENIIGMHYFSPVPMMPLLEVIPHAGTSEAAKSAAVDVGSRQGKTAIVVKDVPGFYVNRCLGPMLVETCALVADGVSLEDLDNTMKTFGLPVGPITLADEVGMDVANHVQTFLKAADMGVRMSGGPTEVMGTMVERGWLGRKTGKGFYLYPTDGKGKKGKKVINPEAVKLARDFLREDLKVSKEDIQNRLISRFVNEAVLCLQDGIIESPIDGDIGAVFGMGFPPFLGGPFRMLDLHPGGIAAYTDMMNRFADMYGEQFRPCDLMMDKAKAGAKFHN